MSNKIIGIGAVSSGRAPSPRGALRLTAGVALFALGATAAAPVLAQQAPAESGVAEIVVTASKRSENLLNVAGSVSALTGDRLSQLGISSLQDFTRLTPGVSLQSTTPGRTQISIRGINVGTTQPSSSVAQYFDETPITAAATAALSGELNPDPDPFDMERIEVLKGPQGTLYGANALGGVIKYVSKAPQFDRVAAAGQLGVGSVHKGGTDYSGKAMVNVPLADWAALRVVGYYRKDAGYIDNVAVGDKDVNWSKNRGGRAILALRPTEDLDIKLTALTQKLSTGGDSSVDAIRTTLTPAFGDLTQTRPVPEYVRDRFNLFNATVSYDFGFATLLSTSSWTDQKFGRSMTEASFSPGTRDLFVSFGKNLKFVQEVRLQSESANAQGLEWQVGGFYTNERYSYNYEGPTVTLATGSSVLGYSGGQSSRYEEKAGFANATYYFSQRFDIAGGIRYAENKQRGFGINSAGNFDGRSGASKDSKVTWTATARYHPIENIMLYGNVSRGYRAGGANFFAVGQAVPPQFDPEVLTNYEAGIKGSTDDKRLTFSLSGFYIDWASIQLPLVVNGLTFRGNNGTAESKGFEASTSFLPIDGLNLTATLSYTDAKITSDERTGVGAVPGERMAGAPRWSGSFSSDYEWDLSDALKGFVGATYTGSSSRTNSYRLSVNTPFVAIPGYSTVGLRAGVSQDNMRVTLAVDNVFDKRGVTDDYTFERYYGEAFGGLGTYYDALGIIRPRTVKLTFDVNY
ncbi:MULTISPECIES: TonB-dependent receptor [unclassified Sphingomonas]|uniref:TonB-dependent receptor n=1 Tax=unclassified Sphingomonas TaxID=196159 RepID=UPI0006F6C2AE|nr:MULTISPECIES: TonB-dependent receptor [unclassified Sphingomonas]KQX25026.1 hypothetical protein ASD17_23380 [Sphingomonas sp. Root1294]KQY66043.1 hypothetical protein ASD39_13180 [Sphingomonas sp. Root50]KRB89792.1 hypothetical protein ASE22_19415 [Sphingomonas sp. Root720]